MHGREVPTLFGRRQTLAAVIAGAGYVLLLLYAGGMLQTGPGPHHAKSLPVAITLALVGLAVVLYFGLVRRRGEKQAWYPWLLAATWGAAGLCLLFAWQKPQLHRTLWLIPIAALGVHLLIRYWICRPNNTGHSA